jgi:hypothetical protein
MMRAKTSVWPKSGAGVIVHVGDGEVSAVKSGGGHAGGDVGVGVDEGEEGVDAATPAQVVKELVEIAGCQRREAHLYADRGRWLDGFLLGERGFG